MKNPADKVLQLGLGALMITKEAIEDAVKKLVEKGKLGKDEAKKLADSLIKKGKTAHEDIKKSLDSAAAKILKKLDIPSRQEVDGLKEEIEKLRKSKD